MFIDTYAHQTAFTAEDFLMAVKAGLRQQPRSIPPKYFYDSRGSELFERICETPEYYPTRTEAGILTQFGAAMAESIGRSCLLIELGSGSASKTPLLLRHLASDAVYMPIDICQPHLLQSTLRLKTLFPEMQMQPVWADYMHLHTLPLGAALDHLRRVIFFPGSSIGNCTPAEALELLRQAATLAGDDGALLIGVDAKKAEAVLHAAYNDAAGITADFNLNLLRRMQQELDAQLAIEGFAHQAFYNQVQGRIEMHLVSKGNQFIELDGERFEFAAGDSIHTENSYKYTAAEFQQLAAQAGWRTDSCWADAEGWFNVFCFARG